LYSQGRNAIETNRYEQAIEIFTQLAAMQSEFQDAASYWRAYSFYKVARTADALTALRDFQQQFKQSRWLNDARALEAEVKQSAGQPISADAAASDDIKLMAARGLIQSDPDKAIPVLERMLSSASSPRLKEQTLFVLSQTNAPRAREIVVSAAKGSHNPDVQVQAIRHIGMMGNTQVRLLADIYRESNDTNVKRAVIRSLGAARGRTELLAVARAEENAELRADAIRQLRGLQASEELQELYRNEKSPEVRRRILEGLTDARFTKWLTEIARQETDPEVKRVAIQSLAQTRSPEVTDTLLAIYASDNSAETRRAVLSAFQMANNGRALVDLARKETDPARKRDIVQRLSMMRGQPEVTEYLLELLK
jgi:HEAT repeat protein